MAFWPFAHHQQRWTVISGGTDLIGAIQTQWVTFLSWNGSRLTPKSKWFWHINMPRDKNASTCDGSLSLQYSLRREEETKKERDLEREHFRKLQKDKMKVHARWDTQGGRDCWTNVSLFPCSVCKIDHPERLVLSTLSLSPPERQNRSSQCDLLTIVLHSLHFHSSSLRMHTQTHRWPFLAVSLRSETAGGTYI